MTAKLHFMFVSDEAREVYKDHKFYPATTFSAGVDLLATDKVEIYPGENKLVGLGVAVQIPLLHFGLLALRSSTPRKTGLLIPNGVGVIDADYRGEIMMQLFNPPHNNYLSVIEKGDRIAQLIVMPYNNAEWMEVGELSKTGRGDGGFGSTGG